MNGIPNFRVVDERPVYRGGQPSTPESWHYLKEIGVKQVLKLNMESEGPDLPAQQLGMVLFACPFTVTEQVITEPDLQSVRDAYGFIGPNTFVHCTHGCDRTGLVIACYRVFVCGWPKAKAKAEMFLLGFDPLLFGLDKAWADLMEGMP